MQPEDWRVLVTGGSGFIGTNLVERLNVLGCDVANLDRAPPGNPAQASVWRGADLCDAPDVASVVRSFRPTHVVHLGARTDLAGTTPTAYRANTDGTRNLLAAIAAVEPAPSLVAASTRMVCRIGYQPRSDDDYCPPNAYGESKVATERIVRGAGYQGTWCLVRPTSIWGPWFGAPYREFFRAAASGRYLHPSGVRVRKSFGYVENTVHQLITLLGAEHDRVQGGLFYLADYEPIEVFDWATRIQRATGGPPVRTAPIALLRVAATAGDVLKVLGWKDPPLTRFRLENLLTEMLYELDPIMRVVPRLPVLLDTGIRRTAEWLSSVDAPTSPRAVP